MADLYTHAFSDNVRYVRGRVVDLTISTFVDVTTNLIKIPKFAFVTDVWLRITTALSGGTPVLTIGFIGNGESADVDGFMDTTLAAPTATGYKRIDGGAEPGAKGKYFDTASGAITASATGTPTAGIFYVLCAYTVLH